MNLLLGMLPSLAYIRDIFLPLLPLLGVALGWILSRWSDYNKRIRDEKAKLNRVIFYLLEIRHQLSLYGNHDKEIDMLLSLNKVNNEHVNSNGNAIKVKEFVSQVLHKIGSAKPIKNSTRGSLKDKFSECIDALSEIDPVLAYRLNGRENIHDLFEALAEQTQIIVSELTSNPANGSQVQSVFRYMQPKMIERAVDDINMGLQEISKRVGKHAQNQIKKIINSRENPKRLENEMKHFLSLVNNDIIDNNKDNSI